MSRNRSIDAMRAISSALVVLIHCSFPGKFGIYLCAIGRFAVPLFLMISGYYVLRDTTEATVSAAKKQLRSTVRLTLIGTMIYTVSNTLRDLISGKHALAWLKNFLTPGGLRRFFLFNRAVFLSSVMYYLFMLLYVYVIYILVVRSNTLSFAFECIPILFISGISIHVIFMSKWYHTGNWLFTGLPFFLLGNLLAAYKPSLPHAAWFILPSMLLCCLETKLRSGIFYGFSTILLSTCILLTCLDHPKGYMPEFLVRFGRTHSVILFLIHCAVIDHAKLLLPKSLPFYGTLLPIVSLTVSIMLSLVISKLLKMLPHH